MHYVFDLDGTLCHSSSNDYSKCEPIVDRIKTVNDLHDQGHHITVLTARGMGRFGNDRYLAEEIFMDLTIRQLKSWGLKYDELLMGKPFGDVYVDDKGISDAEFFG